PRLGDLNPWRAMRQARPAWTDPPSPSQVSCALCLGVHVASGWYPAAYHRMCGSLTRHSHRMTQGAFAFPSQKGQAAGYPSVVSVRCLAPSPPRLTGRPSRAVIMVELFTRRAFVGPPPSGGMPPDSPVARSKAPHAGRVDRTESALSPTCGITRMSSDWRQLFFPADDYYFSRTHRRVLIIP